MESNKDVNHLRRVKKVAYKLNLPEEAIEMCLNYMNEYIKKKAGEKFIDHNRLLTEEEFNRDIPIFLIPSLGWLKPSYYKYKNIHFKGKQKLEKELYKEIKQEPK